MAKSLKAMANFSAESIGVSPKKEVSYHWGEILVSTLTGKSAPRISWKASGHYPSGECGGCSCF